MIGAWPIFLVWSPPWYCNRYLLCYKQTLSWVTLYSTKCLFCFSGWRSPQWSSGLISLTSVAMVISEVELTTSADKTSRAIQAPIGAATLPTLSIYVRSLDLIGWTYYRTRCISSPCYYHAKAIFKCAANSKTHWIVDLVCFCSCLSFRHFFSESVVLDKVKCW